MAEVAVVMVGDAAKLLAENEKLIRKQAQLEERLRKNQEASAKAAAAAAAEAQARAKAADAEKEAKARAKAVTDAKTKAEREEQKVMAQGKALTESLMTDQERFNAKVREAIALKDKGAISAETLQRRYRELKAELNAATGVTERASRVESARIAIVERHGKVSAQAAAALQKYETELEQIAAAHRQGKISAEQLAAAQSRVKSEFEQSAGLARQQKTFIGEAVSGLGQYATAAGAAAAAVGLIKGVWTEIVDQQTRGAEALKRTEDGARALLQISDSPEEFTQLQNQAQQLSSATGVPIERVQGVLFSAVSEGFRDAVPEIIAANQVIAPESAATVAGQVPTLFQGAIQPLEAVNLTLKAARDSRLNFEQIAKALPGAVEGAAIAQASPEETLATLSVLAGRFKSGDVAADRIKGFATAIGLDQGTTGTTDEQFQEALAKEQERAASAAKQLRSKEERVADLEKQYAEAKTVSAKERIATNLSRAQRDVAEFDRSQLDVQTPQREAARQSLAGMGIIKAVEALQAMTEEERAKILGTDQEKNAAFIALSQELGTIKQREQDIIREREAFAQGGGILRERIATAEGDTELTALRERAIAEARLAEAERSQFGIEGTNAATAESIRRETLASRGGAVSGFIANSTGVGSVVESLGSTAGFSPEQSAQATVGLSSSLSGSVGQSFDLLLSALRINAQAQQVAAAAQERAAKASEEAAAAQKASARPTGQPTQPITDAARAQARGG